MSGIKRNSFDTLRLIGSVIVLIGHGFIITGREAPFVGNIPLHSFGVCIFFVISGYLITQSWLSDGSLVRYLRRRLLRIVPALVVASCVTAFVIGPIMTSQSVSEYFGHRWVFAYAVLNSVMVTTWSLPGVFERLPLQGQANGSLWTLPIEFALYLVVPLFVFGYRAAPRIWPFALLALAILTAIMRDYLPEFFTVNLHGIDVGKGLALAPYFWIGSALRLLHIADWTKQTKTRAVGASAGLFAIWLLLPGTGHAFLALATIPIALLVLEAGFTDRLHLALIDRVGDLSYGTYLWAFPVQQAIYQVTGAGPLANIALSLPIVLALAFASWRVVEKPAMRFRPAGRVNPEAERTLPFAAPPLQVPGGV